MSPIHKLIQTVYPQAFSIVQQTLHDWMLAEDCLQDAVEKALLNWPQQLPDNPTAWLITVAKNRAIDHHRKYNSHQSIEQTNEQSRDEIENRILSEAEPELTDKLLEASIGDDVLRLVFCCCHPKLDEQTQVALTLKHVIGFSTTEVANALITQPKTMEQRLLRAKKRLSKSDVPFDLPQSQELQNRLDVVLKVIYLIYNEGYSATSGEELVRFDLCRDAVNLLRKLHKLIRDKKSIQYAELLGLLALTISQQARAPARINSAGRMVTLEEQDRSKWKAADIQESQVLVEKALRMGTAGPYQIQAAISAVHNQANNYDETDWRQIRLLYQALIRLQDTPVIRLNYGMALANEFGPEQGLTFINTLAEPLNAYMPFYAAVAALNKKMNHTALAKEAYKKAIELSDNEMNRQYFCTQLSNLG